jgi:hypothetical protein
MTNPLRKFWRAATPSRFSPKQEAPAKPVGDELLRSDRRAAKRHFHPLPAKLRYGIAASEQPVGIYNFSDTGLCFRSDVRFPVGAAVEVTVTLPQLPLFDGRTVRYLAHVKRVSLERGEFIVGASIQRCETLARTSVASTSKAQQQQAGSVGTPAAELTGPSWRRTAGKADRRKVCNAKADDCRQFSRYRCATHAQFRVAGEGAILSGEVANLSLGGCYIQTANPSAIGASIELVLLMGRNRIYTQGRVTAVKEKQGMGVEFESNLRDCLQRLPRFVQVVSTGRRMNEGRE